MNAIELLKLVGRVRREHRSLLVISLCDAVNEFVRQASLTGGDDVRQNNLTQSNVRQDGLTGFDKRAYMRDYMRRRRAIKNGQSA